MNELIQVFNPGCINILLIILIIITSYIAIACIINVIQNGNPYKFSMKSAIISFFVLIGLTITLVSIAIYMIPNQFENHNKIVDDKLKKIINQNK